MVSNCSIRWRQTKIYCIGRIVWSARFFLFSLNLFCLLLYYAVWNKHNTVRLSILFYFACHAPLKPYNLDVNLRFFENFTGIGKNLTTNIVMLVNLEPNYGLMLEIKIIPNYLQVHIVSAVRFKMGHLLEKV